MSWHAVDASGRDLATGRDPAGPGRPSPAASLAAAPVVTWPMGAASADGRRLGVAEALGPGGDRVQDLLDALVGGPDAAGAGGTEVESLAPATPGGWVDLPLQVVPLARGVEASCQVNPGWLAAGERRCSEARRTLLASGRGGELEAALHVAMLVGVERLDPADDTDVDAHVASGAQLWLLAGAVVSALAGTDPDPFRPWAWLVSAGWWPVGPSRERLVVSETGRRLLRHSPVTTRRGGAR